ncbi:MAG: hypothetical protein ABGW84_02930 [Sphingomonadaceae bacterium]
MLMLKKYLTFTLGIPTVLVLLFAAIEPSIYLEVSIEVFGAIAMLSAVAIFSAAYLRSYAVSIFALSFIAALFLFSIPSFWMNLGVFIIWGVCAVLSRRRGLERGSSQLISPSERG